MHIESSEWPSNCVRDFVIVLQDLCADILNRKPDALMSKVTKDKHWQGCLQHQRCIIRQERTLRWKNEARKGSDLHDSTATESNGPIELVSLFRQSKDCIKIIIVSYVPVKSC